MYNFLVEGPDGEPMWHPLDDPSHPEYNDVKVKRSKLPGAGNGLFAKRSFEAGEVICVYAGTILPSEGKDYVKWNSSYVFALNSKWSVDADDENSCFARYINDPIISDKYNAEFRDTMAAKYRTAPNIPGIVCKAIVDIPKGAEIYASYDDSYWADHSYDSLPEQLQNILYARSNEVRKYVNEKFGSAPDGLYIPHV